MRAKRKGIAGGVLFWILFTVSLVLNERAGWIDRAWSFVLWTFLSASTVFFVFQSIKHRRLAGSQGYPRWFLRFAYDEHEPEGKDKNSSALRNPLS